MGEATLRRHFCQCSECDLLSQSLLWQNDGNGGKLVCGCTSDNDSAISQLSLEISELLGKQKKKVGE